MEPRESTLDVSDYAELLELRRGIGCLPSWERTYDLEPPPPFGKRSWSSQRSWNQRLLADRFGDKQVIRSAARPASSRVRKRPQRRDCALQRYLEREGRMVQEKPVAADLTMPASPAWTFGTRISPSARGDSPGFMGQPSTFGSSGKGFTIAGRWKALPEKESEGSGLIGPPLLEWGNASHGKTFGIRHSHLAKNPKEVGPGPASYNVSHAAVLPTAPSRQLGRRYDDRLGAALDLSPAPGQYRLPSCLARSPAASFGIRHFNPELKIREATANVGPGSHDVCPVELLSKLPRRRV